MADQKYMYLKRRVSALGVSAWSWGNNNYPRKDVTSSCVRKIEVHVLVKL